MIPITPSISLHENELKWRFIRASGPGGQHVNKVATAVQLSFHVTQSPYLTKDVKKRLFRIARNRINDNGDLIITAKSYRSQEQNRRDALRRLINLIIQATRQSKKRVPTRPTRTAKRRRLRSKQMRGQLKKTRRKPTNEV